MFKTNWKNEYFSHWVLIPPMATKAVTIVVDTNPTIINGIVIKAIALISVMKKNAIEISIKTKQTNGVYGLIMNLKCLFRKARTEFMSIHMPHLPLSN